MSGAGIVRPNPIFRMVLIKNICLHDIFEWFKNLIFNDSSFFALFKSFSENNPQNVKSKWGEPHHPSGQVQPYVAQQTLFHYYMSPLVF